MGESSPGWVGERRAHIRLPAVRGMHPRGRDSSGCMRVLVLPICRHTRQCMHAPLPTPRPLTRPRAPAFQKQNHAQQRTELLQKHDEQHRDNPIIIPRVLRPRRASATQSTVSTNSRLLEQLERLRTAQEKRSTGIRSPTHADPGSASRPALQPRRVMVAPSKHQVYVHNQQEKKGRLQPRSASLLLEVCRVCASVVFRGLALDAPPQAGVLPVSLSREGDSESGSF